MSTASKYKDESWHLVKKKKRRKRTKEEKETHKSMKKRPNASLMTL